MTAGLPSYRDLMARKDPPAGSSWGVICRDDEVDTPNFIDSACDKRAAVFDLENNLQVFSPPLSPHLHTLKQKISCDSPHYRDDCVDHLYLRSSSRMVSLRHFPHQEQESYNFAPDDKVGPDSPTIGGNRYAESATLLQHLLFSGLIQSRHTTSWLCDSRIAVGASDDVGFQAIPSFENNPFVTEAGRSARISPIHTGLIHPTLISLMGLCIGEWWALDPLSKDCAATGVSECMVTAKPLNLTRGVGSLTNAVAIK